MYGKLHVLQSMWYVGGDGWVKMNSGCAIPESRATNTSPRYVALGTSQRRTKKASIRQSPMVWRGVDWRMITQRPEPQPHVTDKETCRR